MAENSSSLVASPLFGSVASCLIGACDPTRALPCVRGVRASLLDFLAVGFACGGIKWEAFEAETTILSALFFEASAL